MEQPHFTLEVGNQPRTRRAFGSRLIFLASLSLKSLLLMKFWKRTVVQTDLLTF